MDKKKLEEEFKEEIGFVPPGIMVAKNFGEDFQKIISEYHHEIWGEGAIPLKYRYLIALATAVFDENETRAKLEMGKAIKNGANKEEILEVLKQQVWMKGAPTLVQIVPLIKYMESKFNPPEEKSPEAEK
ncbi:carboxymuconolactone decarboxylase family protein [Isachenkonia alkalipeptolytica]|uniref:Carboxymuconolactone decarboxylase family protein n=1 Tax=Isachenkonia alkalipeptolytica TaxID=2565777 RepID=A0AA44BEC4_9CLOT|nr:carboxymuconolactone decarboxylase family protein [Isachenkonia alkalipeptolytica]NBG88827.1 carboxymuconolactone decarboxylase family protein [Isachenkonia alkalipeptolytica]